MPDNALRAQAAMLCACREHLQQLHLAQQAGTLLGTSAMAAFAQAGAAGMSAASLPRAVADAQTALTAQLKLLSSGSPAEAALLERINVSLASPAAVRPIDELFNAICERAAELYEDTWPVDVRFDVVELIEPPRRTPSDPYSLTAEVDFATRVPTVYLGIHGPTFGPATYSSIPRVLAHECVCHLAGRPFGVVDNYSAFSEGFMDWAAMAYLATWLRHLPHVSRAGAVTHARGLGTLSASVPGRHGAARSTGHYAADVLVGALPDLGDYEARMAVADFAIALNRLDDSLARKTAWVMAVASGDVSPYGERIQAALRGSAEPADVL